MSIDPANKMTCKTCGKTIERRGWAQKYCKPCAKKAKKISNWVRATKKRQVKDWHATPHGMPQKTYDICEKIAKRCGV